MKAKTVIYTISAALAGHLLLPSCASTQLVKRPDGVAVGTLTLHEYQVMYYGEAQQGSGTLSYKGKTHEFSIIGAGAGGSGVQKIDAKGEVFNLESLDDFAGTYTGYRQGITLGAGTIHARLKNSKGVELYISGATSGIAEGMGVDAFTIKLK